jgi:hypothetical protein
VRERRERGGYCVLTKRFVVPHAKMVRDLVGHSGHKHQEAPSGVVG